MAETITLESLDARVKSLEKVTFEEVKPCLSSIQTELRDKSVADAKIASTMDVVSRDTAEVKTMVNTISTKLLDAVLKDRERSVEAERLDAEAERKDDQSDKKFYQKVILVCLAALITIVLAAFGISKIIPLF